ncbi:MAG: hypothetical protein DLD55_02155 [candidate division SR1 bacterium]|nr:MAG: hypothetical protein DLD55_02155 [candidate division SR1 bacterium]
MFEMILDLLVNVLLHYLALHVLNRNTMLILLYHEMVVTHQELNIRQIILIGIYEHLNEHLSDLESLVYQMKTKIIILGF